MHIVSILLILSLYNVFSESPHFPDVALVGIDKGLFAVYRGAQGGDTGFGIIRGVARDVFVGHIYVTG